ncbi:MAG: PDDEXK nuclease domain-containing protein, partial [bacterium]|nr:PDDEXK nuclease domain-containing protein [bacterium]
MPSKGKLELSLPAQLPSPEEVFKDTYDWTFLDLEKGHTERELEEGLMQHIEKVLLELGKGFAFILLPRNICVVRENVTI